MAPASAHRSASSGPDDDEQGQPTRWPWSIAALALCAAVVQVIASIVLGVARLDRFTAAANEPASPYLVVAVLIALAATAVWIVRERLVLAVPLALASPLAIWAAMRPRTTRLGLAYHGEFILHHFSALL